MRDEHIHRWPVSALGVIIGLAKCEICGKVSEESDFPVIKLLKNQTNQGENEYDY